MKSIDYFSCVPVRIILWFDDKKLGHATGFLYSRGGGLFLVTNWHVFSGRNAETGQPVDERRLAIPNALQVQFHALPIGSRWLSPKMLLNQDENVNWLQHKKGQEYDIACVRIQSLPSIVFFHDPTTNNCAEPLAHDIGSNCFVVGYPLSHSYTEDTVVWKSASIATEFALDFASKPCFLVDATTSSGMSGSPVFLRQYGSVRYASGDVGFWSGGPVTEFVGIYSGRYTSSNGGPLNLGYVWKKSLIDQMIDDPHLGSYEIKQRMDL